MGETGDKAHDHDSVVRHEAELRALDRLIHTELNDREQALEIASKETSAKVDRLNERLVLIIDAQGTTMPRAEAKLLIDALGARLDSMQKGLTDLSSLIASLRSSLSGQNTGVAEANARADRNRNLVFAVLGVAAAIIGIGTTLMLAFR